MVTNYDALAQAAREQASAQRPKPPTDVLTPAAAGLSLAEAAGSQMSGLGGGVNAAVSPVGGATAPPVAGPGGNRVAGALGKLALKQVPLARAGMDVADFMNDVRGTAPVTQAAPQPAPMAPTPAPAEATAPPPAKLPAGYTTVTARDLAAHPQQLARFAEGDPIAIKDLTRFRLGEHGAPQSRAASRAAGSPKSPSTVAESRIPEAAPAERAMAGNIPEIPTARASQAGQRHNVPYFSESKGAKVPIEDMNQTHLLSAYKKRLAEMTELSAKGRNAPVKLAELEALKAEIKHRATLPEEMQSNVYNVPKKGDIAAQRARLAEIKAEPLPAAESRPSGRAPFMAPEGLGGAAAAIAPMALSVIPPGVIPGVNTGGMHSMAAMRAQGAALDRGFIGSQPVKASKFGGSPIGGPSPADAEWQSASPSYKRAWISSHS